MTRLVAKGTIQNRDLEKDVAYEYFEARLRTFYLVWASEVDPRRDGIEIEVATTSHR